MPLNINKYTEQIKKENENAKKYKKIGLHIVVAIITALFVFLFLVVWCYITYSPEKESEQKEAKIIYNFTYMNTEGLLDYCAMTDYLPKNYINTFNKKFYNTINYADSILDKHYYIKEKVDLKVLIRQESINYIEKDYQNIKKDYPNITKTDYCKIYDDSPEEFAKSRIKTFKKYHPNLYKD